MGLKIALTSDSKLLDKVAGGYTETASEEGLTSAIQRIDEWILRNKAKDLLKSQLKAAKLSSIMLPTVEGLTGIAFAIIIIVGASLVINDHITTGVMVAYMLLVQRFFEPIRTISMQYNVMQRAMASGYRIFEVLDIPVTIKDPAKPLDCPLDGRIKFDNVSFAYVDDN